jgi:hypothetical protein
MPVLSVRVNGDQSFELRLRSASASAAADEIMRHVRDGDGNNQEIRCFHDSIAVLDVTKVSG